MKARRTMVEAKTDPSMRRQCELLGVNRSSLYYEAVEPDAEELALMRRLDELHLKYPFYGSRKLAQTLKAEGQCVNRKRVQRLMRVMGLESTAPKPNTSKPSPEHARYPYLLRNLRVSRVNQAWATDITYIPMAHGFIYLVAIIDWCSRRVLAWRLSNTMETNFCVEALEEAIARYGCPAIFNTDQGSQFNVGRVRRCPAVARNTGQHGRQRSLARQHLYRASLALAQIRGGLPARVRLGGGRS